MKKKHLSDVIVPIINRMQSTFSKRILIISLTLFSIPTFCQTHTNQNGIQTSVIGSFFANGTQARRFEIAAVGYNSYHWQPGGVIIVELFHVNYSTGYEKYSVEIGYAQGGQGNPEVKLIDSQGINHNAKITLGTPYNLATQEGGYINKAIPVYLDIRNYSHYKVRLTYMHTKVAALTTFGQLQINENPSPVNIPDFSVSTIINEDVNRSGNLMIRGNGNHFIEKGNVGIGTSNPKKLLDVAGTIHAQNVEVDLNNWSDFVFDKDYELPSLQEVEAHIKEHKHLPNIPSEAEVKEEGINIGEMQAKLLQKIEELTLYVIQQEKKNLELEQKLETLQTALSEKQ